MRPLCFVLMPFGTKSAAGVEIRFDDVYHQIIRPAVAAAGLECVRADEEHLGGFIHKPMYERILLCEYAVADLTFGNPNVMYELGIRHATRPWSTTVVRAEGVRLPFDVAPLRGLRYRLDRKGAPAEAATDASDLQRALTLAAARITDSPLFQLVSWLHPPELQELDADLMRDRVAATAIAVRQLRVAGRTSAAAVRALAATMEDLATLDPAVVLELLRAYQTLGDHAAAVQVIEHMPTSLARLPRVSELYAFSLNRLSRGYEAEDVLHHLIAENGPSGETYGLLGRVYKDRWAEAVVKGPGPLAAALLDKAMETYLAGFQTDWRNHYPGINSVELMFLRTPPDPRRQELLPVVRYSARQAARSASAGYWDHATLLEAAALEGDGDTAVAALASALACQPSPWEAASTLASFERLRAAGQPASTTPRWWVETEAALSEVASGGKGQT